ncbi:hypothetical protein FOMPIDRAFT_1056751 [Fomitopsis schrenkii]|uniref:Uncharacterized protein n=1 Tax=Fomitopsis schrenkii TaxID=2126942 RepID=S8DHV0_FOMSC|nr:hypothetical protein FOMPIDRAFT_1056751 [Fomitopsis schrenkii]
MSSHLLNADALGALKRPAIQKIAKREGIKANGKTADIIAALLEAYPNGVEPLEPPAEPVRRSKRIEATDGKAEADTATPTEDDNAARPVPRTSLFGGSISQYVPSPPKGQAAPAAQNAVAAQSSSPAMPPAPPRAPTPAAHSPLPQSEAPQPDNDEPASSSSSSPTRSARLGQSVAGERGMVT